MDVAEIADRYGIELEVVQRVPSEHRGPRGAGCNIETRTVYVPDHNYMRQDYLEYAPEDVLHEMVHIIVQPPNLTIADIPEDLMLLQFERRLARAALSSDVYGKVLSYQSSTSVDLFLDGNTCEYLWDVPHLTSQPFWKEGLAHARRVGLLDAKNKPTWRWPDWTKFDVKAFLQGEGV